MSGGRKASPKDQALFRGKPSARHHLLDGEEDLVKVICAGSGRVIAWVRLNVKGGDRHRLAHGIDDETQGISALHDTWLPAPDLVIECPVHRQGHTFGTPAIRPGRSIRL